MNDQRSKNVFQYAKETSNLFTDLYGRKIGRSLNITGAAITAASVIATGKFIMGILSLSLFTCANAFYSVGMIVAKIIALTGIQKAQKIEEQFRYYQWSGRILIIASLIYIIYSIRLFFSPIINDYHMYTAISIATVTFTEIGLNIRGIIKTRDNHTLLIHAIKMINLSGAFISLVLTQTALLSFSETKADLMEISKANGIMGLLMGMIVTLMGGFMIYRTKN